MTHRTLPRLARRSPLSLTAATALTTGALAFGALMLCALALAVLGGCASADGTGPGAARGTAPGTLAAPGTPAAPGTLAAAKASGGPLPCDLYASGGTPCVAAHSTTRALYKSYNGPLYQVKRASDGATANIRTLAADGYADAAAQDRFCARTYCTVTRIYDQSPRGNTLTIGPKGGAGAADIGANAAALPVTADGHHVYGVFTSPGMGYRDDSTSGVPTGDRPEGEYAVFGGTHYNNDCCYDYGNAETSNTDTGEGHMEAIYFGTAGKTGSGGGPWIAADLENGLFAGSSPGTNPANPSMHDPFVTAIVKGQPHQWAIRGGNARSGGLSTFFSGPRPSPKYDPMHNEGAIILGVGGDNSNRSAGSFFEGAMTSGYPSDSTENAVQASVTAVRYASPGTAPFTPGTRISIRATTACCTADYITHDDGDDKVSIKNVTAGSPPGLKADATWHVVPGLANSSCVSLESANKPGRYLRHSGFQLHLAASDGTPLFANDATFCPRPGNSGQGYSLMSNNYSDHYIRHYGGVVYTASDGGPKTWDAPALWPDDSSWSPGDGDFTK